jgi:two-component system, OmpR family, alkaline phosphatase synthesis response regulator PhoP
MSDNHILVVDDETNIIQLARLYLEREGFHVHAVADGRAALQAVETVQPALVVLDVMLPELDGFEVCRRLRAQNNPIPILMLTARDEDIDKILGLELGADDYMTKPFNPRELVARVKAILRRSERAQTSQPQEVLRAGDLLIDTGRREVRVNNDLVDLRTQEFEVLLVLARNPGQVFSREKLLDLAWGYDFFGQTRTVDVHIAQLRRKLAASQALIETVTGVGYKLVV